MPPSEKNNHQSYPALNLESYNKDQPVFIMHEKQKRNGYGGERRGIGEELGEEEGG